MPIQKASLAISLGSFEIYVRQTGSMTIKQLMEDPQKTLLTSTTTNTAAVIGSSKAGQLIHVGNFSAGPGEVSKNIDNNLRNIYYTKFLIVNYINLVF